MQPVSTIMRILALAKVMLTASFEKGICTVLEGISITRGKETAEVVITKEGLLVKIRDRNHAGDEGI
jgi:hypothetical protein